VCAAARDGTVDGKAAQQVKTLKYVNVRVCMCMCGFTDEHTHANKRRCVRDTRRDVMFSVRHHERFRARIRWCCVDFLKDKITQRKERKKKNSDADSTHPQDVASRTAPPSLSTSLETKQRLSKRSKKKSQGDHSRNRTRHIILPSVALLHLSFFFFLLAAFIELQRKKQSRKQK
jgi:hypothetical protein